MIPLWHLHMVSLHISGGVPEQTVRDEAVGVHTINEWKCSLQGWREGEVRRGWVQSLRLPPGSFLPPSLTMPVSDVKMTISYRGASCWNKVSMPGRFLNLQPVASCRGSKDRERVFRPESPKGEDPASGSQRQASVYSWGLRSTWLGLAHVAHPL